MVVNTFISATTGLLEGCTPMTLSQLHCTTLSLVSRSEQVKLLKLCHSIYNYNIDRLTASVLHDASPCLHLSITNGKAFLCQGEGSRSHSPLVLDLVSTLV